MTYKKASKLAKTLTSAYNFLFLIFRRVLLDAGDANVSEYTSNLKQVLENENAVIQKIVVSHWHHDHIGGVQDVIKLNGSCEVVKLKRPDILKEPSDAYEPISFIGNGGWITTEGANLK